MGFLWIRRQVGSSPMSGAQLIQFGRYHLDRVQGLRCGNREVRLTPKALAVLWVLAERSGQLVAKEDLFRLVWPDTAVTDSALTSCIRELRHAFGDDARRPRFIETVHRRGYRFVARTDAARDTAIAVPLIQHQAAPAHGPGPIVGRDAVLEQMHAVYALAERGTRQVLFVSGEAGVGKTTLVSTLLSQVSDRHQVTTALGQCLEQYGAGEPYQPLLDALTRLCRRSGGTEWIEALGRYAPSWLAQLPVDRSRATESAAIAAGTRTTARMLRELNDVIDAVTERVPLLLWLEDLHWSDPSTLDWLAAFAQRPEPARAMVIGTFRTSEVAGSKHPLGDLADRLRVKGLCRDIALGGLDETAVGELIAQRYPGVLGSTEAQQRLAHLVHQRTGGNPLFLVNVLSDLAVRGLLVERNGTWAVRGDLQAADLRVPHDIRRMIERQIERLPDAQQRLLELASAAGTTFASAAVAAAAHLPVDEVETTLAPLARARHFVREAGVVEWPDGTVATAYEFVHELYREVLYQRIPAGRRPALHGEIGAREEAAYGAQAHLIAMELARHFEESRDLPRAAAYYQQAAESARHQGAHREARQHFEHALALVERQPAGRDRLERELTLRIGLGSVLVATEGWAAPEVEEVYLRARTLCRELGETPGLFPSLWGLWLFYWGRGPLSIARELSEQLLGLAAKTGDRALGLQAHHASWATAFSQGDFAAALVHAEAGLGVYDAARDAGLAAMYGGHDAAACARSFRARTLALMGRADAVQESHAAIAHAQALGEPFSLALAEVFAAAVDQTRRDAASVRAHAAAAAQIAGEQEYRLLAAWAAVYLGWAMVEEGLSGEGVRHIDEGIASVRETGSHQFLSSCLALLAEAHLRTGQTEAGLRTIDVAFEIVDRTGERFSESELHRLRGELLPAANSAAMPDADAAFGRAIEVARRQGAAQLALRAAISRARLWKRVGRDEEARQLVRAAAEDLAGPLLDADARDAQELLAD